MKLIMRPAVTTVVAQECKTVVWTCHASPAHMRGKTCGHLNKGSRMGRFAGRDIECCAGCGCTRKASDDRRKKQETAGRA
jgi:hypothetical protein